MLVRQSRMFSFVGRSPSSYSAAISASLLKQDKHYHVLGLLISIKFLYTVIRENFVIKNFLFCA